MDQPVVGKYQQDGWIYHEIIKMIEQGKAKYESRHSGKEPVGEEKTDDVEPGLPGGAGL